MASTRDLDGATEPFDVTRAHSKIADAGNWKTVEERRLERLVVQVKTQILLRSIPMTTATDLAAWAEERARNIVAGLQDELAPARSTRCGGCGGWKRNTVDINQCKC